MRRQRGGHRRPSLARLAAPANGTITASGAVDKWSIELNSPNNLTRQGWTRHELKAGDKVVLVINPMKDGSKGGLFYAVTLPDGHEVRDPRVGPGPINVQAP